MYSKEELRKIKTDFWTSFGQYSQLKRTRIGFSKKWVLYKTGIKGLELKFNFVKNGCVTAIEIDLSNSKSEDFINKLDLLKSELISEFELFEEINHQQNKYCYFYEKENLNFKNRQDWPDIFDFFFNQMLILEIFVIDNKEILNL